MISLLSSAARGCGWTVDLHVGVRLDAFVKRRRLLLVPRARQARLLLPLQLPPAHPTTRAPFHVRRVRLPGPAQHLPFWSGGSGHPSRILVAGRVRAREIGGSGGLLAWASA